MKCAATIIENSYLQGFPYIKPLGSISNDIVSQKGYDNGDDFNLKMQKIHGFANNHRYFKIENPPKYKSAKRSKYE